METATEVSALKRLRDQLQRIFAMKITRSTFREVQNALLLAVKGDHEKAQSLFESFSQRKIPSEHDHGEGKALFENMIHEFTIPVRLAREVAEKAEFINIITSDAMTQADRFAFLHRIRRIDGEEFSFATDLEGSLSLVQHLLSRTRDLKQTEKGLAAVQEAKQQLAFIQEILTELN